MMLINRHLFSFENADVFYSKKIGGMKKLFQ